MRKYHARRGRRPLGVDVLRIGAVILRLIEDTLVPLQRVL